MKKTKLFLLVVFLTILSCRKEKTVGEISDLKELSSHLSEVSIPMSQLPLYADMSQYNCLPSNVSTRSGSEDESVTLESLLDMDNKKSILFKDAHMTLVPFFQNSETILACISDVPEEDIDNATCVKKYFVETQNTEMTLSFVVTMITGYQYYQSNPEFDYFNMPQYSGAILYSSLEGELLALRIYKGGKIQQAEPVDANEEMADSLDAKYVTLFEKLPETRDGGDHTIIPSICWAYWVPHWYDDINACIITGNRIGGGGSSGGSSNTIGGSGSGKDQQSSDSVGEQVLPNLPPVGIEFILTVTSNTPKTVHMLGSGSYQAGTIVAIDYEMIRLVETEPVFKYWTGALENIKEPHCLYTIFKDSEATAYFDIQVPCGDDERGISNPLIEMRIAATGSGSYVNGTFNAYRGKNKKGKDKYHQGVDFYATEGTPTFAIASGTIVRLMIDAPDHESSYNGSWGNVITIKCDVAIDTYADDGHFENCKSVYLQYSHLQAGNPVAINPRTGVPYQIGDLVYRGDLIGYTGRTGNAYDNVPNPHLHLGAGFEANDYGQILTWIDPMAYINGTIDIAQLEEDFGKANKGQLDNIICD